MPSTSNTKSLKEREECFVRLYIDKGAQKPAIAECEKRAHLKAGSGKNILRRKAVRTEIQSKLSIVQAEQIRQKTIGEAVDLAAAKMREVLKLQISVLKTLKIEPDVLEGLLMEGALQTNLHMFPKEKLEFIKAAAVWSGTFESGNTRRLAPPESAGTDRPTGLYQSLFQRLASNPPADDTLPKTEAIAPDDGIYDLIPSKGSPGVAAMPAPGESLDEANLPVRKSDVITVEVG
jgi:hypothetical protein